FLCVQTGLFIGLLEPKALSVLDVTRVERYSPIRVQKACHFSHQGQQVIVALDEFDQFVGRIGSRDVDVFLRAVGLEPNSWNLAGKSIDDAITVSPVEVHFEHRTVHHLARAVARASASELPAETSRARKKVLIPSP